MIDTSKIPVIIFAGGRGARFDHESQVLPKPLIKVAGKPILQHIINGFVAQGFREFIVATGYLGSEVWKYFYESLGSPVNSYQQEPNCGMFRDCSHCGMGSTITLVDTGIDSHTGERLNLLSKTKVGWGSDLIGNRRFILTYGDGLSNVNMNDVISLHEKKYSDCIMNESHPGKNQPLVTLTAANPPGRFGVLRFNPTYRSNVREFYEKTSDEWINGGFMVCEPEFITKYINHGVDACHLEVEALPMLANDWLLRGYQHIGYWQCMDTRRDLELIEDDVIKNGGKLPWLI
jgi:glucose-1-phosphate cytidylyltransferase